MVIKLDSIKQYPELIRKEPYLIVYLDAIDKLGGGGRGSIWCSILGFHMIFSIGTNQMLRNSLSTSDQSDLIKRFF